MSTLHITHERLKQPNTVPGNYYTGLTNQITIFMRLEIVDGRVKSPISGKLKSVATILTTYPEITTGVLPSVDGTQLNSGVLHLLFPSLIRGTPWAKDYYKLIDAL